MKYLSDYTQASQTKLFEEQGVFFAFSEKQFKEGCKKVNATKDNKVTNLGHGTYCLSKNVDIVISEFKKIHKNGIKLDIEENGIDDIIKRELNNYEAYYTGDIEPAVEALKDYPKIDATKIAIIFKETRNGK